MQVVTHDTEHVRTGVALALVSAASFGLSGAFARPLLDAGWSPGALILLRVLVGGLALLPWALWALRGRWHTLRGSARLILAYGTLAVAVTQFCYFSAVRVMDVGPALLIEFTSPAAVVIWLWLRHGQRPGPLTVAGAVVAGLGLVLVLDLLSGAALDPAGVLWALAAMVGAASYFVLAADETSGLPPITLASAGLLVGAAAIGLLALVGLLPLEAATGSVSFRGSEVEWWVPVFALGLLTAAVPYATGVAAIRRLGSRLASFVALSEALAGVLWAWLLLDQVLLPVQIVGGAAILLGVVLVKLGERPMVSERPDAAGTPRDAGAAAPRPPARPAARR